MVGEHLDADGQEHDRQRVLQVAKRVQQSGEREVQGAQSKDREHVAGEDQERVSGDREDGGD